MKLKYSLFILLLTSLFLVSCHSTYHTAKRKKGQQCDCPKDTQVKKSKTHKIR